MKKVAIFGSTGSIGKSTLRVIEHLPESFQVSALVAHSNSQLLEEQIRRFKPEIVAIYEEKKASHLRELFPKLPILSGSQGINEIASHPSVDIVVMAIVGMGALSPTIEAIKAKKRIGLANKEVLVAGGEFITQLALAQGVSIIPIDSEHSAIFQCLQDKQPQALRRVILTASGGPFLNRSVEDLSNISVEQALAHPTWKMGPKVTIDSSTLMNKALEMIEARWLFDLPPEKIDVVIHPQSIIHSMVEFIDGSILAQLNEPDMTNPIQYALTFPVREPGMHPPFDWTRPRTFEFYPPNTQKFPSLLLAQESLKLQQSYACYLNAANEVLVERFLKKEIPWLKIVDHLKKLLDAHHAIPLDSLGAVLSVDSRARLEALVV